MDQVGGLCWVSSAKCEQTHCASCVHLSTSPPLSPPPPSPLVVSHSNEFSSAALPCVHNFQRRSLTVHGTSAPMPLPLSPHHHSPSPHSSLTAHSHSSISSLLSHSSPSSLPLFPPQLLSLTRLSHPPSPLITVESQPHMYQPPPCSSPCWTVCHGTKGSRQPVTGTQRWLRCERPSPKHG